MATGPSSRRRFVISAGSALASVLGAGSAQAQAQSQSQSQSQAASAPLHILCSGPPGSIPDTVARRVAEQLAGARARTVVVDNRPGAAGQLAVAALKNGPADGSALLLAQGAIASLYPDLYPKLAYDPALDLQPVSVAGEMTLALAVGPAVPASVADVRGLMAWMQREPRQANVGSPGTGTLPHLLEAMLWREAGVAWQHIPYPGGPPGVLALLGGQIAAMVLPEGLFAQHRAAGRLRVLATSGAQRTALLPDVPSLVEQGFADLVVREWFGFFLPGRAAPALADAHARALALALAQPALVAAFSDAGMQALSSTPAAMAARINAEQRLWAPVLRALNLQVV